MFTYDFKDPISEEMKSFKSTSISQLAIAPRLASGSQAISTDNSQGLSANDYLQNLALNGNTIQERSESLVDKLLEISNTGLDLQDQVDDYQMKKTASIERLNAMNQQVAAYQDLIKTVSPQTAVVYTEALKTLIDSVKKETINLSLVSEQLNATQEKLKEWNELNAEPSVLALSDEIKLALIQENEDSLENVILNYKEPIDSYLQFPGSFVDSKEIPSGNEAIIALKEDLIKLTAQLKQNTADISALAAQKEGASKKEQGQIDEKIAALTKYNTALESSIQTEEESLNELTVKAAFATSGVSPSDSSLATLVEKIEELSAQQDVLTSTIAKSNNNTTLANESNPAQLTALQLEQTGLEALAELPFYCTASSLYAVSGLFSGLLHL